ncbi:hypothetical protein B5K11_09645 [Rhizobium leguminosarum bv. trifolii]|uniref:hypothetical protein n=1 Tax=Rhizobium leguminosarum TaxID=384 RepID=UPI000E2F54A5|nr:hypothetical protein [Rhizobium leguminosarum]RFB95206.1 hypothetical protein B5K11_09645 [Rhizobium leguminosarum bv. trifolii]
MKPERTRILLIVAPSIVECYRTAREFGLDLLQVGDMRCVTKPHLLRGWTRATPFIALHRERWPEDLDKALDALTRMGQLRIASNVDLDQFSEKARA